MPAIAAEVGKHKACHATSLCDRRCAHTIHRPRQRRDVKTPQNIMEKLTGVPNLASTSMEKPTGVPTLAQTIVEKPAGVPDVTPGMEPQML